MGYPYLEDSKCLNDKGHSYELFKLKCEKFFKNMMKTKTNIYDKNNLSQNKTIFISNLYDPKEYDLDIGERLFTMCIEFDDPITKGKGYSCFNSFYTDLIEPLEDLNLKISYFFVSNIGCSNLFYFPQEAFLKLLQSKYLIWVIIIYYLKKLFSGII